MTKNFMNRALTIVGILFVGAASAFAQSNQTYTATPRRVALDAEKSQPIAASAVIFDNQGGLAKSAAGLGLTADQASKISTLNREVASLHSERARLWSEYRAVKARPDFSDEMATKEAAPRMLRIVQINSQLSSMIARQDAQVSAILTPAQRSQVAKMVSSAKAGM
jgi:hypothetical protein